jgi:hypothetical protein
MKRVCLLIVFLLAVNFINAQKVSYGLKGGLNLANISVSGEGAPSTSYFSNFHVGGFVEIQLNKKVSFQPELLYSNQGGRFDQVVDIEEGIFITNNTLKLSYINIPMMIKYYANDKLYFEGGPQVGFLTSAKLKVEVSGYGSAEEDVKDSFNGVDFGLGFGLGYNFTKQLAGNFRYNFGLTNAADTEPGDDSTIKNSVFAVSLGYKFK